MPSTISISAYLIARGENLKCYQFWDTIISYVLNSLSNGDVVLTVKILARGMYILIVLLCQSHKIQISIVH